MINIENLSTWPEEILQFLDQHFQGFIGWECEGDYSSSVPSYDVLVGSFRDILRKYSVQGFHCTRLTEEEILNIRTHGLALQNKRTLSERINNLLESDLISNEIAKCLIDKNQSDDRYRANMLWFCFFPPRLAGQHGIGRFFKHWGGKALYNSHESNSVTSPKLQEIGVPCVIEALVPFKRMPDVRLPDSQFARSYLKEKGYEITNGLEYEAYIIEPSAPSNINEIHQFPSKTFFELTGCGDWETTITKQ